MRPLVVLAGALGAATIGGVFFAFSTFVMRALAQLPAAHGVAAMQRINVVVLNPVFLGTFVGTAVLQGLSALLAIWAWVPIRSPLLIAAAVLYVVGSFGVTMACNVPRNERLSALPAESSAAQQDLAGLPPRVDAMEPRPHGGVTGRGRLRHGGAHGMVRRSAAVYHRFLCVTSAITLTTPPSAISSTPRRSARSSTRRSG